MTLDEMMDEFRERRKEIKYRGTHKDTSNDDRTYYQGYFDALSYVLDDLDLVDELNAPSAEPFGMEQDEAEKKKYQIEW